MADLDIELAVNGTTGWIDLEAPADGYELGAGTLAEITTGWRERKIESEWVEGEFVVAAVKTNEVVPVEVWVRGATPLEMNTRLQAVKDAFGQLRYTVRLRHGDMQELWNCQPAQMRTVSSGPLMMALECMVGLQVPRLPTIVRSAYP